MVVATASSTLFSHSTSTSSSASIVTYIAFYYCSTKFLLRQATRNNRQGIAPSKIEEEITRPNYNQFMQRFVHTLRQLNIYPCQVDINWVRLKTTKSGNGSFAKDSKETHR